MLRAPAFSRAAPQLRDTLGFSRSLLGDANPATLATSRALAGVLEDLTRFEDALTLRQDELARTISVLGERDVFVAIGLAGMASMA
jgi:hypothetical protein